MNQGFADKAVLITGCSSGIGYGVAKGLKQRGYRVFATARKLEDVERLQAEGFESLQLDLNDSDSIHQAVQTILELTDGKLYGLFNNGAYGQVGAVEDLSREALREQFETNFLGTHELTTQIIPVMRRQGEGRIIQNSSVLGLTVLPLRGAYNASKYALEGLSSTLRVELYGSGVYVSLIEPGPIRSRFRENCYPHFKRHISDIENSPYQDKYTLAEQRLLKEGDAAPFTLGTDAVLKKVIHALEAKKPKPHYFVTFPTYLLVTLRYLLPVSMMDWVARKIGG
ncbi:SDR family NAD(P)-dependent oxidoreductase [Candidatus Albibeggiatoa sp. nov. NOAA]|uniref:SDR family NAD(P)-dependent oxidoreductase n=1 Tax=Candidatus Albibeggiatoa sp. nov. NOAA TaxID=3162724 RepID=UPI0032F3B8BF|nr:SDR family NAD(P)-dependent oxidoreductase [Thiotrichaceae bacterium]